MAKGGIFAVAAAFVVAVAVAQDLATECGECDRSNCPEVTCQGGKVEDACGCCEVCALSLGQRCDTEAPGACGEYLVCRSRTDTGGKIPNMVSSEVCLSCVGFSCTVN